MTPRPACLFALAAAALAAACVPTQSAVRGAGTARGTEAWSWRMGATDARWSAERSQNAARAQLAARPAEDAVPAAEPEPAAANDDDEAVMTLEPDPVGPARKPKAVAAAPAPASKKARAQPLRTSDSDEEFLDKILNEKAGASGGEITMAAVELPKAAPAKKKKRMTRAERRKALRLARLEKKKAREIAAREARIRGKRTRIDEDDQPRVASARKARRPKKKGDFDENGEGFIDEGDDGDAEQDEVEREIAAGYDDEEEEDDEENDEEDEAPPPARKKAKPATASTTSSSKAIAKATPAKKVKTDWSGQAVDDEDPLKASKKK